jgi:putative ABC transport system permease protein
VFRSLRLVLTLALRNLRSDWFATVSAIIGVALGAVTVNVVLTIDVNTRKVESYDWTTNPDLEPDLSRTLALYPVREDGAPTVVQDTREETHEDYQVMRSATRLGSLSAFLVGALIVFFTFRVIVAQRKREIALLRSLGTTPKQVAAIFFTEALIVGVVGATIGALATAPLAIIAARAGITTTGRAQLNWLWIPWRLVFIVSSVGALTALLGILKPLYDVLRLDVGATLRPRFVEGGGPATKDAGIALIALPFMVLLYILIRPFFVEVLPSLMFFVLEAGLVCAGFLSMLVLVPQVVGLLGRLVGALLPATKSAPRLLTLRRIERSGHELAWAVSGVMLVFALLLSLHIVTRSLKDEVSSWAGRTIRDNAYVFVFDRQRIVHKEIIEQLPEHVIKVEYSGRTPVPAQLMAANTAQLKRFAEDMGTDYAAPLKALAKGKVILSHMMARRYGLGIGDRLGVKSPARNAELEVVGITDAGYVPMVGSYRESRTYGIIAEGDFDLIKPFARPMGAAYALRDPKFRGGLDEPWGPWVDYLGEENFEPSTQVIEIGTLKEIARQKETDDDFLIFDVILLLTAILAAVGIANNLVLAAHVRRREVALYRVLGMRRRQVAWLYVLEGALIGLLGGIMAVVLGVPLGFSAIGALEVVSAFAVHFVLPAPYAVYTVLGAIAISLVSAVYPAFVSTQTSSAESVHYE